MWGNKAPPGGANRCIASSVWRCHLAELTLAKPTSSLRKHTTGAGVQSFSYERSNTSHIANRGFFRFPGPTDTLASPSFLWSKGQSPPGQGDPPKETVPEAMPAHPDQPPLSPQLCFSTSALRDFLRLSRGAIDDSISQNLNALVTPARSGFDPSTTSQRIPRPLGRAIDGAACQRFKQQVLFPSWKARSDLISYCTMVATSPDPNDPSAAIREAEESKNKERVIDERLDPYSARFFPTEPRTERLAILLRQERGVEGIVRTRTWEVVNERCGRGDGESWEEAFGKWQKATRRS